MNRQFYTRHPETSAPIYIVYDVEGYVPMPCPMDDDTIASLNDLAGNTDADVEIALACSMFGWHIPMAEDLS
jgi:hypothetical protein